MRPSPPVAEPKVSKPSQEQERRSRERDRLAEALRENLRRRKDQARRRRASDQTQ